jgi:uncharacterized integral membrane protein
VSDDGERPEALGRGSSGPDATPALGGRSTRFWVVSGLSLLCLVLLVQNSTNADVHVLWFTIRMPLAFLLVVMVVIGAATDRAWQWRQWRRRRR